jgi:hypothetical protein
MFENDTNADGTVSRRSVLELTGGLVAGSTVLAGLGSERGAAATDEERLRADLRERNGEYIAVEVWFPQDTYDEIKPLNDVHLGDADQFVVHDDEDAVSLPEDTEGLATPIEMEDLGTDGEMYGKLLYFRTGDVDWPKEYEGVDVTLAVGAFPERTVPIEYWDTCPGLWIDVREMTEDYIEVEVWFPQDTYDDVEFPQDTYDDVEFPQDTYLGHAERFVVHEEEDAVSLPEDTEGLATPVEIKENSVVRGPSYTFYFRTEDVDLSAADGEEVALGLGLFTERTIPGTEWDANTVDATCPECG